MEHPQPNAVWRVRSLLSELRSRRSDCEWLAGGPFNLRQHHGPAEHLQPDGRNLHRGAAHVAVRCRGWQAVYRQSPEYGVLSRTATSILALLAAPTIDTPVTFRQSATDANNDVNTHVAALYAQDQWTLNRYLRLVGGLRVDRFDLRFQNHRVPERLQRVDTLISPRLGLVVKPVDAVSIYANYSVSYLPSAGDQFASLTSVTQQVKPEKFENYEAGVKWDVSRSLSLTTAVYRLDRTNTRSTDPNDPTRIVQTGSQRTNGVEFGWSGSVTKAWQVSGGVGVQDAFVTSATTAARAGRRLPRFRGPRFRCGTTTGCCRDSGLGWAC